MFLVVSITSGALSTLASVASNIESVPELLAQNLPDASNYFFSYLLLQGASVSSGTLLQISALVRIYSHHVPPLPPPHLTLISVRGRTMALT